MQAVSVIALIALFACAHGALKSIEEVQGSISGWDASGGKVRAYQANFIPTINPRLVTLTGVSAEQSTSTANIDAVVFVLNTIAQSSLSFAYYTAVADISNASSVNAAGFALLLRNFGVFEFVNNDGVPGYQNSTGPNADVVTGSYDLSNLLLPWKTMVHNTTTVNTNGKNIDVTFIQIETQDEVFSMRFTISGDPIQVGSVKLTPDSLKIDYDIKWFTSLHQSASWTTGPSSATTYPSAQVGLIAALATASGSFVQGRSQLDNSQPSVNVTVGAYTGFFNFESTADVTVQGLTASAGVVGNVQDVQDPSMSSAFNAGWSLKALFFSFDGARPSEVTWDPEMGASIDYTGGASAAVSHGVSLFLVAAMVALFRM